MISPIFTNHLLRQHPYHKITGIKGDYFLHPLLTNMNRQSRELKPYSNHSKVEINGFLLGQSRKKIIKNHTFDIERRYGTLTIDHFETENLDSLSERWYRLEFDLTTGRIDSFKEEDYLELIYHYNFLGNIKSIDVYEGRFEYKKSTGIDGYWCLPDKPTGQIEISYNSQGNIKEVNSTQTVVYSEEEKDLNNRLTLKWIIHDNFLLNEELDEFISQLSSYSRKYGPLIKYEIVEDYFFSFSLYLSNIFKPPITGQNRYLLDFSRNLIENKRLDTGEWNRLIYNKDNSISELYSGRKNEVLSKDNFEYDERNRLTKRIIINLDKYHHLFSEQEIIGQYEYQYK